MAGLLTTSSGPRGTRTRSFGGCATCRRRHMKCDESRPTCNSCRNAGLSCGGYNKAIFFSTGNDTPTSAARFRRPLFTEHERSCMSDQLVASVPPGLALWQIGQIDEQSEKASSEHDFEVCHGPFGAFRLAGTAGACDQVVPVEQVVPAEDVPLSLDMPLTPWTRQVFQSVMEEPLLSPMDLGDFAASSARMGEIFDFNMPAMYSQSSVIPTPAQHLDMPGPVIPIDQSSQLGQPNSPESLTIPSSIDSGIPHDVVYLIKHYSTTILKSMTPFCHTKTPWHTLFVPHAKHCLAALTLGEALEPASLCAFYAILAIAAFSLGATSASRAWLEIGLSYQQLAREHAKRLLKIAYNTPKAAKYKTILMALLNMVHMTMMTSDIEQTDRYFLEAERFIRVKGLNRRKSRKVRMLHHCYSFERILHESTVVRRTNLPHRRRIRKAIEASGALAYSQDSLTFRLGDWHNLDKDMMRVKDKRDGENDLHHQLPGVWSDTLHPEIFGVPEVFVFLLSVTVRLADQRAPSKSHDETRPTSLHLEDFMRRAKAVEGCIKSFRPSSPQSPAEDAEQRHLDSMMKAMQNALAIYFYRKVYDVDASLLQAKVQAVCESLADFKPTGSEAAHGAARLIWPAYIAASEAEDPAVKGTIVDWLNASATCSGSRLFSAASADVERVWTEKHADNESSSFWANARQLSGNG